MESQPILLCVGVTLGSLFGSFVALVVQRFPKGETIVWGRSHCDGCRRTLRWWEVVPIFSWIVLRGRCASCGVRIDPLQPQLEFVGAGLGFLSALLLPPFTALTGLVYGCFLLALTALDIRHLWLPDRIVLPLGLAGLLSSLLGVGVPPADAAAGCFAGFGSLALVALLYRRVRQRDGLGGGDPKLFGAIGAWSGWSSLPTILLGACLLGFVMIALDRLRGRNVSRFDKLPLGALLAATAWPIWLLVMVRQ